MEDSMVGKYFALLDEHGMPEGRAVIVEHIHGPFYIMNCFGFVDESDCQAIFSLEHSGGMPIFPSLDKLENYIGRLSKSHLEHREVSH